MWNLMRFVDSLASSNKMQMIDFLLFVPEPELNPELS